MVKLLTPILYMLFATITLGAYTISPSQPAYAQNDDYEARNAAQDVSANKTSNANQNFNFKNFPSLLFTLSEQESLNEARLATGLKALPSDADLEGDIGPDGRAKPSPEERFIRLAGISYKSARNWTIWLNQQRVTPKSIPTEIIDLKVFQNYIEVQWFDEYTNQIFPIRLRPREQFHIDTKTFLPG